MKILNWFEKQHFLSIWKRFESNKSICGAWALNEAFTWNRPDAVSWLIERGFTLPMESRNPRNAGRVALECDCLPLLQYVLKLIESRPKLGEDPLNYEEKFVSIREIRTDALIYGAAECWKYLMSLDDVSGASGAALLDLLDWDQCISRVIYARATKGLELGKDWMKKYDSLVKQMRLEKNSKSSCSEPIGTSGPLISIVDDELAEDNDADLKTIAELLVDDIRESCLSDVLPEYGDHKAFEWLLDHEFITINGSDTSPSLAAALLDVLHLWELERLYDSETSQDPDHDEDVNDVDDDDPVDEHNNVEEALQLLAWLYNRGADLKAIKGMHEHRHGTADILELIESWPYKTEHLLGLSKICGL
jgi:hypothetical protein